MSLALTRQERSLQERMKEFAAKRLERLAAKIEAQEFFPWRLPSRARDEQVFWVHKEMRRPS